MSQRGRQKPKQFCSASKLKSKIVSQVCFSPNHLARFIKKVGKQCSHFYGGRVCFENLTDVSNECTQKLSGWLLRTGNVCFRSRATILLNFNNVRIKILVPRAVSQNKMKWIEMEMVAVPSTRHKQILISNGDYHTSAYGRAVWNEMNTIQKCSEYNSNEHIFLLPRRTVATARLFFSLSRH